MSQKQDIIIRNISPLTVRRLEKLKEQQGFAEMDFGQWLTHMTADVKLQDSPGEMIQKHTKDGLLPKWMQNLGENLPKIKAGNRMADLVPELANQLEAEGKDPDVPIEGKSAIAVGKGPTVFKFKHFETLAKSDYKGSIVSSDGSLLHLLKAGVIPANYDKFVVMTVDGNAEKIWKLYDDPLVDEHGKDMHILLASTVAPNVVARLEQAKAKLYFFHPIMDDYRENESFTKLEQYMTMCEKHPNGIVCLSAGGNSGTACWIFSWVVLRRGIVGTLGIDFGYLDTDDLTKTYYWEAMMQWARGNVSLIQPLYHRTYNPDWNSYSISDPVMRHYKESFLDMIEKTPKWLHTYNITMGGNLFGNGITPVPIEKFLEEYKS